jgi:hypothetical protein
MHIVGAADQKAIHKVLKPVAWNEYVLRAEGRRIRTWLNGVPEVVVPLRCFATWRRGRRTRRLGSSV